jgi:hypothetical protein
VAAGATGVSAGADGATDYINGLFGGNNANSSVNINTVKSIFPDATGIGYQYGAPDKDFPSGVHEGLDIDMHQGTQVTMPMNLTVTQVVPDKGNGTGYGNEIIAQDEQGNKVLLGHFSQINVKPGDVVAAGTPVGLAGSTGRSTGSHVHIGMYDANGKPINPSSVLFTQSQTKSASTMSPLVSQYLQTTTDGSKYINLDRVASNQQNAIRIQASKAGIPALGPEEVAKVRSLDITTQNLAQMKLAVDKFAGSGLWGSLGKGNLSKIAAATQSDPNIAAFGTFRDTAINSIQALAGGSGSGFRLNQAEINTAVSNLPTISDNKETAEKKIALMQGFLDKWHEQLLPGQKAGSSSMSLNPSSSTYKGITLPH